MYVANAQQYPSYALNVVDIHLRSSRTLLLPKFPLITKIPNNLVASKPATSQPQMVDPTNVTSSAQTQTTVEPPFKENLIQSKPA